MEPVTFKDSKNCTQTYDHSHSVSGVPPVVCGAGSDGKAKAAAIAKDAAASQTPADKKKAANNADPAKDAKDAKASKAKADAKAAKPAGPKSGKPAPAAPPAPAALVSIDGSNNGGDPTFLDANKCVHTYVSPGTHTHECPLLPADKKGDPITK